MCLRASDWSYLELLLRRLLRMGVMLQLLQSQVAGLQLLQDSVLLRAELGLRGRLRGAGSGSCGGGDGLTESFVLPRYAASEAGDASHLSGRC